MSFSFLGGLASLLPGYLQGQRMANQDNWQDLMNYNQTQQGQLSNAFITATWQPRINRFYEDAIKNNLDLQGAFMDYRLRQAYQPYAEQNALWRSYYAQPLAQAGVWADLQMMNRAGLGNGNLGQVVRGNTPSNI